MARQFKWDKWSYDCDGDAYIIAKAECPNREDVPAWVVKMDNLDHEVLNPAYESHLSVDDVKDGWCKYQVRTDWENGDGEPKGGYAVYDAGWITWHKRQDGKTKAGWFEVWIVRLGEWY